jgi:hypothetical protein
LNTGAKVAIGCGAAVLLGGMAMVAGVVGLGFWAKGKAEKIVGAEQKIQDLQKRADANVFTPPADGIIQEDRLVKFLDVRKKVFSVYLAHKDELDAISKKKDGSFSDVTAGLGILNEARLAQAQGLSDVGMSQTEYGYLVAQIYKTAWHSAWQKDNDGKSFSQWAGEATDATTKSLQDGSKALGKDTAAEEKEKNLTPEQRQMLDQTRKALDQMKPLGDALQQQRDEMRRRAQEMDVPPQNIALFRKHEDEIKKYAMGGLEWMGL